MADFQIVSATTKDGITNAYVGTTGADGYIYFNDADFYRFKPEGTWEDNQYIRSRGRYSWAKTNIFTKLSVENLNAGSINGGGGSVAPNGTVEQAVQWAIDIANDDSHGYDWGSRNGPDYDCSSLVYWAFHNAGFDIPVPAGNTQSMIADFTNAGFVWHAGGGNTSNGLLRGDILLNITSHTEIYIGENMNVGAHINEFGGVYGGQTGDQTGNEISVSGYYSYPWDGFLRYGE